MSPAERKAHAASVTPARRVPSIRATNSCVNSKLLSPIHYVYFPVKGMISLVTTLPGDNGTEVGATGNEGMAGIPIILGVEKAARTAICQIPGRALRIPAEVLREEFQKVGQLQSLLLRYVHVLMSQITQMAACNRRHKIERRLARWLLTCADRTERNELPLTHEFLSQMPGTRRSDVSIAANALQHPGLIQYKCGDITILNRPGLTEYSCPCYQAVAVEYEGFIIC